jgi:ribonuclease HI
MEYVEMAVDGSCHLQTGIGAYAAVITSKKGVKELYGAVIGTTNNRMEMMGAVEGLKLFDYDKPKHITIYSDSQYLVYTMTQGWRRKANLDLWEQLDTLCLRHDVQWVFVKGHNVNDSNKRADRLCRQEMRKAVASHA